MSTPPLERQPMIGQAPAFTAVLAEVSRAAPLSRPLLVVGERGTGKELMVARLHYLSPRWQRPLVRVNCAALAESLLESELFGHEMGAFTGAARRRPGRFELADGGTLFLDEIASASPGVQEKVLRVIEYGTFERVGGVETLRVDVRVVAAGNMDLPALAAAGRFRPDLLDRLAFDVLTVPPLRQRREDIPLLAEHFGVAMARELGWEFFPGLAPPALAALLAHPWPGNVRELKNVIERTVYRSGQTAEPIRQVVLDPFDSPWRPVAPAGAPAAGAEADDRPFDFVARVDTFETGLLRAALARHRHNQRRTAEHLGLTYHQLRHYLRKHGLAGTDRATE